ncbi:hypothetical protein [Psychromonas aquimarina]|uniref:hypothetical protein n=1 Tax=Psychromonas aquimarina TaxID=444919 RepID=UPI0004209EC3|nr:hypothetical protein [Psychromonas aquimarina]
MYLDMFLDIESIFAMTAILLITFLLYRKEPDIIVRVLKVSELSTYLAFTVSLVWLVYLFSTIDALKELGPGLAFSLILMLYASMFRVAALAAGKVKVKENIKI